MLDRDKADRLLAAIDDHYRPMVEALLWTGVRWGDREALTIADYMRRGRPPHLVIGKAAKIGEGGRYAGPPKTKSSRRLVSLTSQAVAAVETAIGGRTKASELIFTAHSGAPVRNTDFRKGFWYSACEEAELVGLRPHDLRHTHASWCVAAGLDLLSVQRRLGHVSIQVTVDRYGHLRPDALQAAVDALEAQ